MDDVLLDRAEDPLQHVVEMHADVGGDAAALVNVALPRSVIPLAAGSDVGEIHVVDLVLRTLVDFLLEGSDAVVQAELEDVVGLVAGLLLDLLERIDVVRVEHHGLLADDVAAEAQAVADKCVVRVVRSADAHPVQGIVRLHLPGAETIEELVLSEERALREETVEAPDTVEAVISRQQVIACILDGFEMARRNVAGRAYKCEIGHYASVFSDSISL